MDRAELSADLVGGGPRSHTAVTARIGTWVTERRMPVMATCAMFVPVLAYSLLGHAGLHGEHYQLVAPSDLWGLVDSSWALVHGQFAHIYVVPQGTLTSPPALEVALAPVLLVAQATGLASHHSGQPVGLWLLLAPVVLVLASTSLFAVDAVAREWDLPDGRRLALALLSALCVANVTGLWGHPEDCIAVALVLWSALALERHGNAAGPRAALLLGIGIAYQPLAILAVAPVLTRLGWRAVTRNSWRLVVPSLVTLAPALIGEPGRTRFVLLDQPFLPGSVSFTPLTRVAPVIGHGIDGGGPTRLLATLVAVGLAVVVCRRHHDLPTVLSMGAVAFFLRVLFETELNWYYVWPVAAVCLLLAARRSGARLAACSAAVVASIVLGNHNTVHHIVLWWPALMAALVVMLASASWSWTPVPAPVPVTGRDDREDLAVAQVPSNRSAAW